MISKVTALNVGILLFGVIASTTIINMAYAEKETHSIPIETTVPVEKRGGYILKEYNGKIGVFRTNAQKPYTYVDMDINYLTEYDRELLTKGIEVDTQQQLNSLIEDITS